MLTFGIEEEFLLVDPISRDVVAQPAPDFLRACSEAFGEQLAGEMFQSQLELVSPVLADLGQAATWLQESRRMLAAIAARFELAPLCAGAHPFADWRVQVANPAPHYRQLFADYRDIAGCSLVNGLHVHVGIPAGVDRIQVMNRVLPWLPLLLALSVSSPFWEGRRTGVSSYRRTLCGLWPRMNLPEPVNSGTEYQARIDTLMAAGALRRETDIWWFIRPSARFPTLELRITDACPRWEDTLCIASLFRALVTRALITDTAPGERWVIEENYWRARRDGAQALMIPPEGGSERGIDACLRELVDCLDGESTAQAQRILQQGTSAQRQLATYAQALQGGCSEQQAVEQVVDQLLAETAGRYKLDTEKLMATTS